MEEESSRVNAGEEELLAAARVPLVMDDKMKLGPHRKNWWSLMN